MITVVFHLKEHWPFTRAVCLCFFSVDTINVNITPFGTVLISLFDEPGFPVFLLSLSLAFQLLPLCHTVDSAGLISSFSVWVCLPLVI